MTDKSRRRAVKHRGEYELDELTAPMRGTSDEGKMPSPTTQLLTLHDVKAVTKLSRTALYNRLKDVHDPLPRPLKMGRVNRWSEEAVN